MLVKFNFQIHPWLPIINGIQQEEEKIAMVRKGEEDKVENKKADENTKAYNEGENKGKEEKTKEETDKQGDKGEANKEVDDTRNPTRLQDDETEIGDLNPADPNQAKWGYSDQEIRELESDKIFD